jgi:putative colanic acid biosynthesis acetyltransferase WcaF
MPGEKRAIVVTTVAAPVRPATIRRMRAPAQKRARVVASPVQPTTTQAKSLPTAKRVRVDAPVTPPVQPAPVRADRTSTGSEARFRPSPHALANRLCRSLWGITWLFLFRPSPKPLHAWRRLLLRLFGAGIGEHVVVHPSARIWGPWNLVMGPHSCLSPHVDCYSVDSIRIGAFATVSQYSFLCTASHDPDTPDMRFTTAPIIIGDHAWIAADVFVGPGVTIGEGAVVGVRSTVLKNTPPWTVVAGKPARLLRKRSRAVATR